MKTLLSFLLTIITLTTYAQVIKPEVEISATSTNQSSYIPQVNLGKVLIDSTNRFTELPQYLRQEGLNITTTSDGSGNIGYSYLKLRGMDSPRVNFTLNGVPLNDQLDGWFFTSNLPDVLSNFDAIQIQYGAGGSSYGTAPIAGSIHFKGTTPNDNGGSSLEYTNGSFGYNRYSVSNNTGLINKRFKFYTRYSNVATNGFRDNSAFHGNSLFSTGGYYGDNLKITYTGIIGDITSQMCYLPSLESNIQSNYRHNPLVSQWDRFNQRLLMVNSKYTYKNFTNESSIYFNQVIGNFDVILPDYMVKDKVTTNGNTVGAFVNNTFYINDKVTIKLGTNVSQNIRYQTASAIDSIYTDGRSNYLNQNIKRQVSQFLKIESHIWGILRTYFDLEGRVVNMQYQNKDSNNLIQKTWSFINPKFGLSYFNELGYGKLTLNGSVSMVTREPFRLDVLNGYDDAIQYSGGDATKYRNLFTQVSPESVVDYELGGGFITKRLDLYVNLYHMEFQNEIAPVGEISLMTSLPIRKNISRSFRRGVEILAKYNYNNFRYVCNVNYNQSLIRSFTDESKVFNTDNVLVENNQHLLSPQWVIKNGFTYSIKGLVIGFNNLFVSESFLTNNNQSDFKLPQYSVFGGTVSYKYEKLEATLFVDNIFNTKYYTSGQVNPYFVKPEYFVQPTTNYTLSTKLRF